MDLRSLDDRVVPVAAAQLRRVTGRLDVARSSAAGAGQRLLRLLRDRPPVSVALLAALVAAAVLAAVTGHHENNSPVAGPANTSVGFADVGPTAGQSVTDYVAGARQRLAKAAAGPDRDGYAVVDFSRYLTVDQAGRIVDGFGVARAYFKARVPGAQTQPHTAVVQSMQQVAQAIGATARVEHAAAASFSQLARAIPARTATEKQVQAMYVKQAGIARIEARALTPACACVYALVVRGKVSALRALAEQPGVRVVDPAPSTIPLEGLGVIPLLPEVTGTVPLPGRPTATPPH